MRRRAVVLFLGVALGALLNVAVAWGCALFSSFQVGHNVPPSGWPFGVPADWPAAESAIHYEAFGVTMDYVYAVMFDKRLSPNPFVLDATITRLGWPMRAVHTHSRLEGKFRSATGVSSPGMWQTGLRVPGNRFDGRPALGLMPLWPGFAGNTLIYALVASVLMTVMQRLRSGRRSASNRCPSCGYSLAGLAEGGACPECGRVRA